MFAQLFRGFFIFDENASNPHRSHGLYPLQRVTPATRRQGLAGEAHPDANPTHLGRSFVLEISQASTMQTSVVMQKLSQPDETTASSLARMIKPTF
ncbi:MAG: hypothetical protein NTX35_08690 [Verrucomicrobia bacterium]|nr:hypothetical protein [Verrucomicrobiota bacterium]